MSDFELSYPQDLKPPAAEQAAAAAKSPLPKAPQMPKAPSTTGGVTDQNNPGSLASPDFSEKALQDGADTDSMFADVQKKLRTCRP